MTLMQHVGTVGGCPTQVSSPSTSTSMSFSPHAARGGVQPLRPNTPIISDRDNSWRSPLVPRVLMASRAVRARRRNDRSDSVEDDADEPVVDTEDAPDSWEEATSITLLSLYFRVYFVGSLVRPWFRARTLALYALLEASFLLRLSCPGGSGGRPMAPGPCPANRRDGTGLKNDATRCTTTYRTHVSPPKPQHSKT